MPHTRPEIRGFRLLFTLIGVLYVLLASSMLVRGVGVLRDFAVPEEVVASPVVEDFFLFFYQLMAFVGVLTALLGQVTRGRAAQTAVAGFFCASNVLIALRDLSTSDSRFGNHLYRGEATLVFVLISVTLAMAFGVLLAAGLRSARGRAGPDTPTGLS